MLRFRFSVILVVGGALLSGCKTTREVYPVGEFLPQSERFWEVVPPDTYMECIGINFEFTEGPSWHPKGYLVFSDIPANTIYRWTGRRYVAVHDSSNQANGLLVKQGGDLLVCEHGSRSITRISPDGRVTTLVDSYRGKRLNSPNDLCRSASGAIFFTDPPWGLPLANEDPGKELPFNGVYRWHNGQLSLIDSTLSWPNGIALSPDERYLYVANLEIGQVDGEEQYDVFWMKYTLGKNGEPLKREVFFRATDTSLPGGPDGMKVDKNGNLFVTGPGGILVLDSSGTHLGTISVPEVPSNLAFGPREKEIYVTARTSLYKITLK